MSWRTGYIVFASFLAAFGFGWSAFCLILRYATFETETRLTLTSNYESVELPSLSLCYTYSPGMENATVAEIWKTFPSEKEVIEKEKSFVLSSTPEKMQVKKYLMDKYICYSISLADQVRRMHESDISSVPAVMASIAFKPGLNINGDKHSLILMHDGSLPGRRSPQVLGPKNGVTLLTYGYQWSSRLPEPYDTNCIAYEKGDIHSSQSDCMNHCRKEGSSNLVPPDLLVEEPVDLMRGLSVNGTKTNRHNSHTCEWACRPDCGLRVFWPRVLSTEESEETRIDVVYPTDGGIAEISVPTMTFGQLLTNLIELMLFWAVVSPLPFIVMEKTIVAIVRSEEELKVRRNGVRPYVEPAALRTQRSADSAGQRNNKNNNESKVISTSFSLENEGNAT